MKYRDVLGISSKVVIDFFGRILFQESLLPVLFMLSSLAYPTDLFAILEPHNPSMESSERQIFRWQPDFEAVQL